MMGMRRLSVVGEQREMMHHQGSPANGDGLETWHGIGDVLSSTVLLPPTS